MPTGKINNRFLNEIQWQQATPAAFALPDAAVHIWRISVSNNLHRIDDLLTILNPAELARANRYVFKKDRQLFIISRAAQRMILGQYLAMPPALLQFELGPNNKPYIGNANGKSIQYNLSHSANYALLAVSAQMIGCDVEYVDTNFKYHDILPEHFSTNEANYINHENSTERFYCLWTRKEAILKGTGQGLTDHLKYTNALDGVHNIHPTIAGSAYQWQVNSFLVTPDYMGTVATPIAGPQLQFWETRF